MYKYDIDKLRELDDDKYINGENFYECNYKDPDDECDIVVELGVIKANKNIQIITRT